jgi:hypothetical protein
MNEVTAYKTASGLLTTDKAAAECDEREFLFKKKVEELVEEHGWNGMNKDDIVDFIIDHKKEILETYRV